MATVIRGGTIVNVMGRFQGDLRVEGGRITALGVGVGLPGDEELDASGCYVIPGGIDPHTHIEMPAGDLGTNADDWYSGTAAAVAGGTTCVLDMIAPEQGGSLVDALQDWQRRAAARAVCDFGFHMGVIDARPATLAGMAEVVRLGVPSFKIYLAYKGRIMVNDGEAFQILRQAGQLGALTLIHAENGELVEVLRDEAALHGRLSAGAHGETRPPFGEGEATYRAIELARAAGAPVYIVHVSCREALEAIRRAQQERGQAVIGEACTHHLVLTDAEYERPGFEAAPFVLSPPLRSEADQAALWEGFSAGTLRITASDHCPWNLAGQKDRGRQDFRVIPNGGPGIEERMALLWTHGVEQRGWSVDQFVSVTSTTAARLLHLNRKGLLLPGYDADIVVWAPAVKRTLSAATQHSRVDHSMYEGMPVTGQARYVLVRGRVAAREGHPVAEAGSGQFVTREVKA